MYRLYLHYRFLFALLLFANASVTYGLTTLTRSELLASLMAAPSLSKRLATRNSSDLKNQLFNIPPSAQTYPEWMHGRWDFEIKFDGFIFPSSIPKQTLIQNFQIPGFQKCSIAELADVGRPLTRYIRCFDKQEDRLSNLKASIDEHLGYQAVNRVTSSNQNRFSIEFVPYKTVNAERIELFCNARESEEVDDSTFLCSEYLRQVTFGTGSTVGVPRQVGTSYAHFWTYQNDSEGNMKGNLLTAGYLDPQDPLYFQEPLSPVVVYSHLFQGRML